MVFWVDKMDGIKKILDLYLDFLFYFDIDEYHSFNRYYSKSYIKLYA